jgi:flagellar hook-associated protein 1
MNSLQLTIDASTGVRESTRLAAENIMGSGDSSYVKRSAQQVLDVLPGGQICGIVLSRPQRAIDTQIQAAIRTQGSEVHFYRAKEDYLIQLDNLNGSFNGTSSMDEMLLKFTQKAGILSVDGSSSILKKDTVNTLEDSLESIRKFAEGITSQRRSVENNISSSISSANFSIKRIQSLNEQIAIASHTDQDITSLESLRDQSLRDLSEVINFNTVASNTDIYVYTSSGVPIVENGAFLLQHISSNLLNYSAEYPTSLNPITIQNAVDPNKSDDITKDCTSGKIGGYLDLRDNVYPKYQKALDEFSKQFQNSINKIHNLGSGFPPAAQLNGSFEIENGTQLSPIDWKSDATIRIALVDSSGLFKENNGQFYCDINLNASGINPLSSSDIVYLINQSFGSEIAKFSEGNYGTVSLEAPTGLRVAIGNVDNKVMGETNDGIGFSEYFHLNDLIVSSPDEKGRGYANTIQVRNEIKKDASLFAIGSLNSLEDISISSNAPIEKKMGIASGDGQIIEKIRQHIDNPILDFTDTDLMPTQKNSLFEYIESFVSFTGQNTAQITKTLSDVDLVFDGLEQRYSIFSEVNIDEEFSDIFTQKILYQGILSTSKYLMEMINQFIKLLQDT